MDLMIGGDSEIGARTALHLTAAGREVVVTTRRTVIAPNRVHLDFDAPLEDWSPPAGVKAACIFVAVARLAACDADPAGSVRVNCEQTLILIHKLVERGVFTLFLSTNQVFDGTRAHVASDAPHAPVSEYGRQKAKTEAAILSLIAQGAPTAILRLAKVASPGMPLIAGWRRELAAGRPINAFLDMAMAPTPTDLVAQAIAALLQAREPVVAQLTGPRDMTYDAVARLVASQIGADETLVHEVSARDHGQPIGATPKHTTLDSAYLQERHAIAAPDVAEVVPGL